jgi:hypothetical protein
MTHVFEYTVSKCGESKGSEGGAHWDTNEALHGMAPLQMIQLLEKGEHNPSQISRDHQ